MDEDSPLFIPQTEREQELIIVGINDGESYHKFGIDTEFMPIDDLDMWTHEFSERTIHELTNGGLLPVSMSIFPNQIFFRIHHMMVSLHTPSIIRIEDQNGNTLRRKLMKPEEFCKLIKWHENDIN